MRFGYGILSFFPHRRASMIKRSLTLLLSGLLWAGLAIGQININTASPEELDGLKGIGQ